MSFGVLGLNIIRFGAQLWPFWAQTDLYPLLINLVVVVGCFRGSGRRVRHLLSQAFRMYNSVYSPVLNKGYDGLSITLVRLAII